MTLCNGCTVTIMMLLCCHGAVENVDAERLLIARVTGHARGRAILHCPPLNVYVGVNTSKQLVTMTVLLYLSPICVQ